MKIKTTDSIVHRSFKVEPAMNKNEEVLELNFIYNNHTQVVVVDVITALKLRNKLEQMIDEMVNP